MSNKTKEDEIEKVSSTWEGIGGNLERMKIPGGWLVKVTNVVTINPGGGAHYYNETRAAGLTFVPDSGHKWGGSTLL